MKLSRAECIYLIEKVKNVRKYFEDKAIVKKWSV